MLAKIYRSLLKFTSSEGEKGEYSAGYLQGRIRKEALGLCRHIKGNALEIGCGEGLFLAQLEKENRGLEIWGIDNDEARLRAAADRLQNVNLSNQDAEALSFGSEYFDTVICINVLFNMRSKDDVKRTLAQMKRICKRGGSIIFDIRNSMNPVLSLKYRLAEYYDDTLKGLPLRTYSFEEIETILNDLGMKVANKKYIGFNSRIFSAAVVVEAKRCR